MGNWDKTGTLSREIHLTVVRQYTKPFPISGPAPYKYSITYTDYVLAEGSEDSEDSEESEKLF